MKIKLLKGAGVVIALAVLGLMWVAVTRAQPGGGASNPSLVTTNWVGCLVIGKNNPMDNMAEGLFPTAVHQVQIGLRSDGVVVWRDAKTK